MALRTIMRSNKVERPCLTDMLGIPSCKSDESSRCKQNNIHTGASSFNSRTIRSPSFLLVFLLFFRRVHGTRRQFREKVSANGFHGTLGYSRSLPRNVSNVPTRFVTKFLVLIVSPVLCSHRVPPLSKSMHQHTFSTRYATSPVFSYFHQRYETKTHRCSLSVRNARRTPNSWCDGDDDDDGEARSSSSSSKTRYTVVVVNDRGVVVEVVYTRPTVPRVGTEEGRS